MSLPLGEKIRKQMVEAINDYHMLADGDRVLVAVSGGKDSAVMVTLLEEIRRRAKISFTLEAVLLDQKQPGFDATAFQQWMASTGVSLRILEKDTYSIVVDKVPAGKTYCGLCSRLRRGILYNYAHAHGFTKIALGHHRDDMNETLLMNVFYAGQIGSMPPKLFADDGRNVVIRPLAYAMEKDIAAYAQELAIPLIPCKLCGSQANMKRARIKQLLRELETETPHVGANVLNAMRNVRSSQLLDAGLWDFKTPPRQEQRDLMVSDAAANPWDNW